MRLLALACLALCSCTVVREIGPDRKTHVVLMISSNATNVAFRSPRGTFFSASVIDNASVHSAIGNEISKGILSAGTAIATSGLAPIRP